MDLNQKLISDFLDLGCLGRKDAVIAVQVYLELCEIKKYWNVECKFHPELKVLYITGKKTKCSEISIFVPKSASDNMTFNKMRQYFQLCVDSGPKSVFLVFVSNDSTCVYYQITDGLCEAKEINNKHFKENKQERVDVELRKHRGLIEHAALCGTSVSLKK